MSFIVIVGGGEKKVITGVVASKWVTAVRNLAYVSISTFV